MLSQAVDYNFIFSSTFFFFLELMVSSFLFAFLVCSCSKLIPKAPVVSYYILLFFSTWSNVPVIPIVLWSSFLSVSVKCVTCWWQACFFWGFLCCSLGLYLKSSGFSIKCMGTTFLATVYPEMCLSCLYTWMVILTNFSFKILKIFFIVFTFPVFLLVIWSCFFVCKLFTLSLTQQEFFSIVFLFLCALKPHDVLWSGSFYFLCRVPSSSLWFGQSCPLILRKFLSTSF